MKKGCIFLMIVWVVAAAGYFYFLKGTEFNQWWLSVLLGFLLSLMAANIAGIFQFFGQLRASRKPIDQWKDGELVGISGRIDALRSKITAPFSGKPGVIIEYAVKRTVRHDDSKTVISDYSGFLMTPCAIQSPRGSLRLAGFPLLANLGYEYPDCEDRQICANAAKYLKTCKFKVQSKNPLKAIAELNAVLADEDGDVREDFRDAGAVDFNETDPDMGSAMNEEEVTQMFFETQPNFEEQIVAAGSEITVFGTYDAKKKWINVGSGVSNLSHQLHLGPLSKVLSKNLRKAIFGIIFWGVICTGANWYVLGEVGLVPKIGDLSVFHQSK